jgi:two-component system, response regulator PdtaR
LNSAKPLRILIVEDEILIALELESVLQDAGHTVVQIAASSREAVDCGSKLKPDLAFVDIHLADGPTGVDVARRLREIGVAVLFMTANAKRIPDDYAGAEGVISKPYTERGVREALQYVTADPRGAEARRVNDGIAFIPFDRCKGGDWSRA